MYFINSLFIIYLLYMILNITSNGGKHNLLIAADDTNADSTKINNTNNILNDQICKLLNL